MEDADVPWTGTWCVSVRAKVGLILHPPLREESGQRIIHALRIIRLKSHKRRGQKSDV